jgi:5-methylcytosine-specific restriction enzyme A
VPSARAQKRTDAFYVSPAWRRFRNWYLANHPFCEICLNEGRLVTARVVDHILEIKDGGALTSEENAMALCWKCHGLKTAEEKNHLFPACTRYCIKHNKTYKML